MRWKLLEPDEIVRAGDESWSHYLFTWVRIKVGIGERAIDVRCPIRRRDSTDERLAVAVEALETFATNSMSDENCASVELASKRVRTFARDALERVKEKQT